MDQTVKDDGTLLNDPDITTIQPLQELSYKSHWHFNLCCSHVVPSIHSFLSFPTSRPKSFSAMKIKRRWYYCAYMGYFVSFMNKERYAYAITMCFADFRTFRLQKHALTTIPDWSSNKLDFGNFLTSSLAEIMLTKFLVWSKRRLYMKPTFLYHAAKDQRSTEIWITSDVARLTLSKFPTGTSAFVYIYKQHN